MNAQLKQEERQAALSVKQAKKKLEIRRKDVLRADTSARVETRYGEQGWCGRPASVSWTILRLEATAGMMCLRRRHEYANYLASIHLLQEMGSRP